MINYDTIVLGEDEGTTRMMFPIVNVNTGTIRLDIIRPKRRLTFPTQPHRNIPPNIFN